jgi:hypothetical protein
MTKWLGGWLMGSFEPSVYSDDIAAQPAQPSQSVNYINNINLLFKNEGPFKGLEGAQILTRPLYIPTLTRMEA